MEMEYSMNKRLQSVCVIGHSRERCNMVDYMNYNQINRLVNRSIMGAAKEIFELTKATYMFGTNGVVFTLGCTTSPIAKIPPPRTVSRQ
jgi:hypothetical protein